MKGGDHSIIRGTGLTKLIRDIRVIETALGSDAKRRLPAEESCFIKLAKSIVSTCRIQWNHSYKRYVNN